MVKEKLKNALEDAVGYYNSGMSANDAIVKSAMQHDLTIDQTDRVVESFNTAKTINFFDKNASDRTGKFDLASKKDVTLSLFGKNASEKRASATPVTSPDSMASAFYTSAPDRSLNRKNVFAEKRAALLDALAAGINEKWAHDYSDNTFQGMASDAYSFVKSAEADIADAIGIIDNYLWTATEKIASDLAKGPYDTPVDRANLFKAACPHEMVIREVSKFSPLLKAATGGVYAKMNVVDTTPVDDLLKEADDIMQAVEQRKVYRAKKAEFRAKAEALKEAMLKDPSMSNVVPKVKKASDLIHAPVATKKAGLDLDSVLETVDTESNKKVNEQLRDDTRGANMADLMSSDPILMEADPRQVASLYKSLIAVAPRVSLNKEIARAVLRSAINSVALSPADSKIFTDVDKGIQTAFGGFTTPKDDD